MDDETTLYTVLIYQCQMEVVMGAIVAVKESRIGEDVSGGSWSLRWCGYALAGREDKLSPFERCILSSVKTR